MPKSYGQCSPGGPLEATHVPVPKVGLAREGSDIVSRINAAHAKTPPPPTDEPAVVEDRPDKATRFQPRYDRDEIRRLYQDGKSGPQIARELGCSHSAVYKVLNNLDIDRRDDRKKR